MPVAKDEQFLSAVNPCATVDQREIEDVALRLMRRPEIDQARKHASLLWRSVTEYTAGPQMALFEAMSTPSTTRSRQPTAILHGRVLSVRIRLRLTGSDVTFQDRAGAATIPITLIG